MTSSHRLWKYLTLYLQGFKIKLRKTAICMSAVKVTQLSMQVSLGFIITNL